MGTSRKFFSSEEAYKLSKQKEKERYYNRVKVTKSGSFSTNEDDILLSFKGKDVDLAIKLGRSIKSVQDRRRRLRKKGLLSET